MVHVQLAPEQPEQLRRLTHQKGLAPSFRNRLERVRLADAGGSAPIIARHLGYHEETVREWPKRFLVLGFEGLKDQPRSGHPRRFTEARRQALEAHPDTSPQGWTAPQLVAWLRERFGVEVSADHLQEVLRERGFRWKRTQPWVGYHRKDKPKDQSLLLFRLMVCKAMGGYHRKDKPKDQSLCDVRAAELEALKQGGASGSVPSGLPGPEGLLADLAHGLKLNPTRETALHRLSGSPRQAGQRGRSL